MKRLERGYCGIGIFQPLHATNVGTLFRSAYAFGADFVFTIGRKYRKQASDTPNTPAHLPCYHYLSFDEFKKNLPEGARLVLVETEEGARDLPGFIHPERAVYLLGAESGGIPKRFLTEGQVVKIPTDFCLNVSTAGSITLYDRVAKRAKS